MTDLTTSLRPTTIAVPSRVLPSALITEQHVLFSSAAAVAVPPLGARRWVDALASVAAAVGSYLDGPKEPASRHHPKRHADLENALMAREMYRL